MRNGVEEKEDDEDALVSEVWSQEDGVAAASCFFRVREMFDEDDVETTTEV